MCHVSRGGPQQGGDTDRKRLPDRLDSVRFGSDWTREHEAVSSLWFYVLVTCSRPEPAVCVPASWWSLSHSFILNVVIIAVIHELRCCDCLGKHVAVPLAS